MSHSPDPSSPAQPEHNPDPVERFRNVLQEAEQQGIEDPNAMVLSTVDGAGRPSSRVVLLKGFDARGFVFYTNYESRKGRELLAHPEACLNFFWRELGQQVRAAGPIETVSDAEADAYFASRHRGSRIGAWASQQSRPLSQREELVAAVADVEQRFPGEVPRPPHWSGFRLVPRYYEFWVSGEFRLHDRALYEATESGWQIRNLYP